MTAPQLDSGYCEDCDSPQGGYICRACAKEQYELDLRAWFIRKKTVYPGLTNAEIALVEELIRDMELGTP